MENKVFKILNKVIIVLLLMSFMACQSGIVYGMNFANNEFRPPTPPSSGGGSVSPSPNPGTTHTDNANSNQTQYCEHPESRYLEGSVVEVIDSTSDTTIGTPGNEALDANSTKTQKPNYDDVKVTIIDKNNPDKNITTNVDENGNYTVDLLGRGWSEGNHEYSVQYVYPTVSKAEINAIDNLEKAKKIQQKLKYNSQDYTYNTEGFDHTVLGDNSSSVAQVFLALDCSQSMNDKVTVKDANGNSVTKTKLNVEKEVAQNIVNSLLSENKNIYIGIVVFTETCYRYVGLTNNSEVLNKALSEDNTIELDTKEYTNIYGALEKCADSFAGSDDRYIFLLSDGLPTSDGTEENRIYYASPDNTSLINQNNRRLDNITDKTAEEIKKLEQNNITVYSVISKESLDDEDLERYNKIFIGTHEHHEEVESLTDVSQKIIDDFKKYVSNNLTIQNKSYGIEETDTKSRFGSTKYILNNDTFTYNNTQYTEAIDMELTDSNIDEFKNQLEKLCENSNILTDTITVKAPTSINLHYATPHHSSYDEPVYKDDGETVDHYIHHECITIQEKNIAPTIYLKKLPSYSLTPSLALTGMALTASNGTKLFTQTTKIADPKHLMATLESKKQYGSVVTLRYTIGVTNSSVYTDTKALKLLFYIPDGFDYNPGKETANVITDTEKINISKSKSKCLKVTHLSKDNIDDIINQYKDTDFASSDLQDKLKNNNQRALLIDIDLNKNKNAILLQNGSLNVNLQVSKLLGNDTDMAYSGDAEILSYTNSSKRRISYQSTSNPSQTVVSVAGNNNHNYSSLSTKLTEQDYTVAENQATITPPTGKDKSMRKVYIALSLLGILALIVIIQLIKSKHNKDK